MANTSPTAADALRELGEAASLDGVAPQWDAAMRELAGPRPEFLDPAVVRESRAWAGFDAALDPVLIRVAETVATDPSLLRLAWHCYWRVFRTSEPVSLAGWPLLKARLGDDCGVFYLLVGLGMVPLVRAYHASLGVPEDVTRDTCQQVRCYCETHQFANDGRAGLLLRPLPWLRHYTREPYFRLGRLEYWLRPNPSGPRVFRNRRTHQTIAMPEPGTRFTADGYIRADLTPEQTSDGWVAELTETEHTVTGTPISPFGMALRQQLCLPKSEWECVLQKGDPVLQMHIPSGGGLTPARTNHTIRRSVEFFRDCFPDSEPRAIVCGSWIFSNQLEQALPPDANLVRFLREFYLYPVPSTPSSGLWFIFLQDAVDPATGPRRTSLQRAIADFLAAGNTWRVGGMFMLTEDVPQFGTQHYRSNWPPEIV